jgi:hypothetical protein
MKTKSSVTANATKAKTFIGGRTIRLTWQETENCRDSEGLDLVTSSIPLPLVETSVTLPRVRRASFEDPRPLPAKTNYELRRCKSEVAQPSDPSVPVHDAGNPSGIAQNALTSKDKIQAKFITFFRLIPYQYIILLVMYTLYPMSARIEYDWLRWSW